MNVLVGWIWREDAGRAGVHRRAASVATARARCQLLLALLLAGLCGCTDLRLSQRSVDPAVQIDAHRYFRFAREPLGADARIPADARALDQAVRAAIAVALRAKGLEPGSIGAEPSLAVDYTIREVGGVNARRLDSPSDYSRSWRADGPDDGTGSMDHTVADAAFYRELSLTVLLSTSGSGGLAWEGTAQRSFPGELPRGHRLQSAVDSMVRKVLAPLPARR